MISSLTKSVPDFIRGQDNALSYINTSIAAWESNKHDKNIKPLVLAFTGSTGVGKTETAYRLASSILKKKIKEGNKYFPAGLLVLRGEDYSDLSEAAEGGLKEVHRSIRSLLVNHLSKCGKNSVVIFDEVQKVIPGTLDVLVPALSERGSIKSPNRENRIVDTCENKNNSDCSYEELEDRYHTGNCIFIFISDIGSDRMIKLLLTYGSNTLIPKQHLRSEVKLALDDQWNRLQFSKHIKDVIPFLPLQKQDIHKIADLKLNQESRQYESIRWSKLLIDDVVISHITDKIKYTNYTSKLSDKSTSSIIFSTYGARSLENSGPLQDLRGVIYRYMQPWRPKEILHVGLTNELTQILQKENWGGSNKAGEKQIFLQWCLPASLSKDSNIIDINTSFSDKCATIWFGYL
jgi:DNA polymerase III delta prime subunit